MQSSFRAFQSVTLLFRKPTPISSTPLQTHCVLFTKGTQWVCGEVEEIGAGYQQWNVTGSEAREEDRVRSVGSGHAVLGSGEPAIHLRCPRISF